MSDVTLRAQVLAEALPYIQKYYGKTIVIKYGGSAMISRELREAVIGDVILLSLVGIHVVVVHGGGPEISAMLKKLGKESRFVDGLRCTDAETMDVVQQVLCGKVNKNLAATLNRRGGRAIGLCGLDAGLFQARLLDAKYGLVGELARVDPAPVRDCLTAGYIPVVSTVAQGVDGENAYNINADTAAARLAVALGAEKLILLTDVHGLLRDPADESTLLQKVGLSEVPLLVREGVIQGGMIPKVECCVEAVRSGVERTHILDGRIPHSILIELLSDEGIGTMILEGGADMTFDELKALDHAHTLQTYGRFDVDVDHGQGATLWDLAGRTYIDFTSGIGVCSVGYGNEKWARAIYDQALALGHISNLFYSQPYARLAGALCARSGMAAAFFGNSGAEANEGLLKLARKYSHDKYGAGRGTILTLRNSFHGRTLATLAATGQDVFHQHFFPFPEGFRHTGANDLADVEAQAGEDVCAVLLELVQGEGGVLPMDRDFVRALAGLCEQRDWLLLVDEVQTGIGRTGTLFAFQQYGIRPDAVSFAKGIAGGLPMGGFLVNEKCRPVLGPGSHASTFGGNPVCSAAALAVLDILDEAALNRVREKGAYLREHIEAMGKQCLGATRGLGLMIGVEVRPGWSSRELAARLAGHGLLVLTAGPALRLLPPLTITKGEMDQGLAILDRGLE